MIMDYGLRSKTNKLFLKDSLSHYTTLTISVDHIDRLNTITGLEVNSPPVSRGPSVCMKKGVDVPVDAILCWVRVRPVGSTYHRNFT